jgi:hypothetical protein
MAEKEMTKAEMKERLTELQGQMEQVVEMQKAHSRRLTYLRSFERFANGIDTQLTQLRNDVAELNNLYAEQDGGQGQ